MKTSHGKLALLAFLLLAAAVLLLPMQTGMEDKLLLEPLDLRMLAGDSYTLRCALSSDRDGQSLRFESADARVASIDADGTVRAHAPGETLISAQASGGARAQMRVSVVGTPLSELTLNISELHLGKGQFSGLRASYNADASDARLQWVSSDERVVRVNASGRVEGVGGGVASVSVLAPNGRSASATVYVDVPGTAVHIAPNALTLGVGAQVPLRASYLPADCTDSALLWSSSDTDILTVDAQGVLRAMAPGEAYVGLRTRGGLTDGMVVRVEEAPEDIQLSPAVATLERGDEMRLQLMFMDEQGNLEDNEKHLALWSSSDPKIAQVDQQGLVTAISSGSCIIRASADGMTAECRLKVEVGVREIVLDKREVWLLREQTAEPIQLHWTVMPDDPDDARLQFSSNNEMVALVSPEGEVSMTGGYGTAIISAVASSGATASFTVNVVTELPETNQDTMG